MPKPTKPQLRLLKDLKIKNPPPKRGACAFLIDYILKGNGTEGCPPGQKERVALYEQVHEEWTGKEIVVQNRSLNIVLRGIVRYITAKPLAGVLAKREDQKIFPDIQLDNHPLHAMVSLEDRKANFITVGALRHAPPQ